MILDCIKKPGDLKRFSINDLDLLALEIREVIITQLSKNGGHLSSNLGTVELTIALHKVFDCPEDKIIWDVGHQCYAHKLLTGRLKNFQTLRKWGGMAGFPKRRESVFDVAETGHGGTSLSLAAGLAKAFRLKNERKRVVAVIGDGSLCEGMAFEAINYIGDTDLPVMIVLNDNGYSISKNVGKLSNLRLNETRNFWGIMGFKYFGPWDGHNIGDLLEGLQNAKNSDRPIVVHVLTNKGKGYFACEKKPWEYHWTPPFNILTGKKNLNEHKKNYINFVLEALPKVMERNPETVGICAAMPHGTGLVSSFERFPDRMIDVGMAEQNAVTVGAGLALGGLKPIVAIHSTFFQRSFDQLVHDVCIPNLPVLFLLARSGLVGEDGETHHGVFDFSYLRCVPNLEITCPIHGDEIEDLLEAALKRGGPQIILFPHRFVDSRRKIIEKKTVDEEIGIVYPAFLNDDLISLPELLRTDGWNAAMIPVRWIKPFEPAIIEFICGKLKKLVTVEENALLSGFGSSLLEILNERMKNFEVLRVGLKDEFVEHGNIHLLHEYLKIDCNGIKEKIIKRWGKNEGGS